MYATKLEFSSFRSLRDMTSQKYPFHAENESSNTDIYPWKMSFTYKLHLCPIRSLQPKIDLPC